MRTYAVADLHGRNDLLERVLEIIELDAGEAGGTFICLGDFTSRGPDSRKNVQRLMAGPHLASWRWIVLQGNHEAMLLKSFQDARTRDLWWEYGGQETLSSYGCKIDGTDPAHLDFARIIPEQHVDWLSALPLLHQDDHRIFAHAGIPFDCAVSDAKPADVQWMLYEGLECNDGVGYYPDRPHVSGKHVVHGHHEAESNPLLLPHRTNLDGLAVKSGRAAVAVFESQYPGGPCRVLTANAFS